MKNKNIQSFIKKKNKVAITLFIVMLCFITTLISVGFSALNQSLNIAGDVEYEQNTKLLYDVLKKESRIGTYAREYVGSHHDSYTEEPTKSIYHWYASSNANANIILDKWNVIFGGVCWQMIRTTDTGGVKLIYNGEPNDGKCNNSGTAQQVDTSMFNYRYNSPAYAGYMYNTIYSHNQKRSSSQDVLIRTTMTGTSNYYYGTGVTYDSDTNQYTLTGTTQNTWANTYDSSSGLYTCRSTTSTQCSTVYYIAEGASGYMYGFRMIVGNLLTRYNTDMVFGTGYTESNGTYTLTGTTTLSKANWFNNHETYKNYYTCGDNNTACTDLKYITSTNNYQYYLLSLSENYVFAKNFSYDSGTDTYTLSSDRVQAWEMSSSDRNNLSTHHYTCFNDTGECNTLSYVYNVVEPSNITYIYYIELTSGKSIEDAKSEMLYNNNVNVYNSNVKNYVDYWYADNMIYYDSYLEDTIFCSNRSQTNASTNGWNPNGGSVNTFMNFNYDSLMCSNDTDKFSVSNNKASLPYPIGLATYKEMSLLNNNNLRKTGEYYWLISPYNFDDYTANESVVTSLGDIDPYTVHSSTGVRPVVSLKPGTEYASGDGSKNNPYIIETRDLTLYSCGFESQDEFSEWTLIDADGDGYNWEYISNIDVYDVYSGNGMAISRSWIGGSNPFALDADNYLITPEIELTGFENVYVDFYVDAQDSTWADKYAVLYGPTNNPSQMTTAISLRESPEDWEKFTIDLSDYDESTLYVAFRHKDNDQLILKIDNVSVHGTIAGN